VLASSRRHAGNMATGAKRFQRPSADTWGTVDESDKALIHVWSSAAVNADPSSTSIMGG
jgi:hypothetical protein